MAYSNRHRYKNRREKYKQTRRNIGLVMLFASIALIILVWKNRLRIYDFFVIWFL